MWYHMNDYGWGWGWGGMWLGMLVFWVLLAVAIALLLRWTTRRSDTGERVREKTALDILKERYARGKIQREEFEQKKRDLQD